MSKEQQQSDFPFILGFILGVTLFFIGMNIVRVSDVELSCELGYHDPECEVNLSINQEKYVVANYWVRCKRCGSFLSGITSDRLLIVGVGEDITLVECK